MRKASREMGSLGTLRLISNRFLPKHMAAFDEAIRHSLHRTDVVRITLNCPLTGKCNQYDKKTR